MKIIVTGVNGQLGFDVVRELKLRGYQNIYGIDIEDLDITNQNDVNDFFREKKPNLIIHCAAYTTVDKAEENRDFCMNVNLNGTRYLIDQAIMYDAKFVYISTDYVFDGEKNSPYEIDDQPNPKSVYGQSKYFGELETMKHDKYFIVRTSWVFGKNGTNFIKTMLRLSKEKKELNIINDQLGSPTYTYDLSKLLVDLIETDKYGIYHGTNEGICTWYEFAKKIFELSKIMTTVHPILSAEYPMKAKRPNNSVLSKESLYSNGFKGLPYWEDALKRYLKEIEVI